MGFETNNASTATENVRLRQKSRYPKQLTWLNFIEFYLKILDVCIK